MDRILPVYNATCDKCRDPSSFKEVPILQNIKHVIQTELPEHL